MSMNSTIRWGIDLGTTNSALAILTGDKVRVVPNKHGDEITPSTVYFMLEGGSIETEVGKKARQRLPQKPRRVALEFKQKMGKADWRFAPEGIDHKEPAQQLSARVLRELKNSAHLGGDFPALKGAVVTVPAAFGQEAFEDTSKAAVAAGIEYVELLPEPVAAALAFGRQADTKHNPTWLAYDLGGGTFDAALVRGEDGVFSVLDHDGDRNLGGKNLDNAIVMELVAPKLPQSLRERLIPWESKEWWILKAAAEEVKCALSVDERATFEARVDTHDVEMVINRRDVDVLQVRLFARTLEICHRLLRNNGLGPKDIEKIILVGGPTLSPFLRHMIENGCRHPDDGEPVEGLGIPIDRSVNPLTAVAEGAAVYAAGRRMPAGVVQEPAVAGKEPVVALSVKAPAQVREDDVLVAGELRAVRAGFEVSGCAVVFERMDTAGNPTWQSEPVPVGDNGRFAKRLSLAKGLNEFLVQVLDARRDPVAATGDRFEVLKGIGVGQQSLPRGIGVADANGRARWFFKKGDGLPAEHVEHFRTTVALQRGRVGTAIRIPAIEGRNEQANLNRTIHVLEIRSDQVTTDVPADASVQVTMRIDESKRITMEADLEDYEVLIEAEFVSMPLDPDNLRQLVETTRHNLNLCRSVMPHSEVLRTVVDGVERSRKLDQVERLLAQGTPARPEPWDSAEDLLLEVRALIEPHLEEVDELLDWETHQTYCDRNVSKAKEIVGETSGLSSEWRGEFDQLCKDFATACQRRDRERSEEIAFGEIPRQFEKDAQLKVRVGGGSLERGVAERTAHSSAGIGSTIQ